MEPQPHLPPPPAAASDPPAAALHAPRTPPCSPPAADQPPLHKLARLDHWMAGHPWHPRVLPFIVYLLFLPLIAVLRDWHGFTYPLTYAAQCSLVAWLLWRYRALLPELTVCFHWLAVPVGIFVAAAWIALRYATNAVLPTTPDQGWSFFDHMPAPVAWFSLALRLIGMSLLVPLFEELFIRSLLLRSFHNFRRTAIGLIHFSQDLPVLGEWLMGTRLAQRANRHEPVFGREFLTTPLGALSAFGVAASTFVFMIHHRIPDWPGAILCGIAYCLLLAATARRGLGPVVWAHGITNALIWLYVIALHLQGRPDWQLL